MKKILETMLVASLVVLPCIVLIDIILRYGFQTNTLSVDELSHYLFVWLTFIGTIVAFMDNAHVQVTSLVEKLSPAWQWRVALATHFLILFICSALAWGTTLKIIQDWNDYLPILGLPIGLMYAAYLPTSLVVAFSGLRHLYQLIVHNSSLISPPRKTQSWLYWFF